MSKSVLGGFGEQALERIVMSDTFVAGEIEGLYLTKTAEYYSGPVGSGIYHTGNLETVKKWANGDNRDIRIVGVSPNIYLKLFIPSIQKFYYLKVNYTDLLDFGEFKSLTGSFKITEPELEVKVNSDTVLIEGIGKFEVEQPSHDVITYSGSSSSRLTSAFNRERRCLKMVDKELREAWAREKGIHSASWRICEVKDYEHSSGCQLTVWNPNVSDVLKFTISMDDWDEKSSLRSFIEKDGDNIPTNLENEKVFVSLKEWDIEPIAETGPWKLYRESDKPNIFYRVFERYLY